MLERRLTRRQHLLTLKERTSIAHLREYQKRCLPEERPSVLYIMGLMLSDLPPAEKEMALLDLDSLLFARRPTSKVTNWLRINGDVVAEQLRLDQSLNLQ